MNALALVLVGSAVVGGCRTSSRPVDAAEVLAGPAATGSCRDEVGPLPFVSAARPEAGAVTVTFAVRPEVRITDSQVRDVVRVDGLPGSTTTPFTEVGQLATAPAPACTYTVVTPTEACLVAPTGVVRARRSGHHPYGSLEPIRDDWWIEYELGNPACTGVQRRAPEDAVVVVGAHPTMRVVRFGFDVSYTSAGAGGEDTSYDGSDMRRVIAAWPADEQARYRRGPGFAAYPSTTPDGATITRELTWFSALDAAGRVWSTRLRDRTGAVLLAVEADRPALLLREGDRLYWSGGRIR